MDRQEVNGRPALPIEGDQPYLFSGYSTPHRPIYLCLLFSHRCNKTPGGFHTSLQGDLGGNCCSRTGNLSMLISFLETLLTVFAPKEKDERGRCRGNKSHNQSRWESQTWQIDFLSLTDVSRFTKL